MISFLVPTSTGYVCWMCNDDTLGYESSGDLVRCRKCDTDRLIHSDRPMASRTPEERRIINCAINAKRKETNNNRPKLDDPIVIPLFFRDEQHYYKITTWLIKMVGCKNIHWRTPQKPISRIGTTGATLNVIIYVDYDNIDRLYSL